MILTEELLAPYRSRNGKVAVSAGRALFNPPPPVSSDLFTPTTEFFGWPDRRGVDAKCDLPPVELLLAFTEWVPVLDPTLTWYGLVHQAGGHSCEQVRLVATRLVVRPELRAGLNAIAQEGAYAERGHFSRLDLLASRIVSYVAALKLLELDCECTWRHLTESVYPIDATQENLDRCAVRAPNLSSLADWGGFPPFRYSSDPALFFITENSD